MQIKKDDNYSEDDDSAPESELPSELFSDNLSKSSAPDVSVSEESNA